MISVLFVTVVVFFVVQIYERGYANAEAIEFATGSPWYVYSTSWVFLGVGMGGIAVAMVGFGWYVRDTI